MMYDEDEINERATHIQGQFTLSSQRREIAERAIPSSQLPISDELAEAYFTALTHILARHEVSFDRNHPNGHLFAHHDERLRDAMLETADYYRFHTLASMLEKQDYIAQRSEYLIGKLTNDELQQLAGNPDHLIYRWVDDEPELQRHLFIQDIKAAVDKFAGAEYDRKSVAHGRYFDLLQASIERDTSIAEGRNFEGRH